MTREEFAKHCIAEKSGAWRNREPSDEEYAAIEIVYMHHPAISASTGKADIARIYAHYGITVIYDMLPRAEKVREAEERLLQARRAVEAAEEELEEIKYSK